MQDGFEYDDEDEEEAEGKFTRSEKFGVVVRSSQDDLAELDNQVSKIPNFDSQFLKVIIE